MKHPESNTEGGHDRAEELYTRWRREFGEELDRVLHDEHSDIDELVEVIWEKGILDHAAPTDPEVIEVLQAKGKPTWDRENPETYWKILYSAGAIKHALENEKDPGKNYITGPIGMVHSKVFDRGDNRVNDIFPDRNTEIPVVTLAGKIIEKARQELIDRGQVPHEHLFLEGSAGHFEGILVKVSGINEEGMVRLDGIESENSEKLSEAIGNQENLVSPSELDPKKFATSESETIPPQNLDNK